MSKKLLITFIISLILSVISGLVTIPILKKLKAGQTVLKYVETHKNKNGTPTMGGLFFILSSAITFFLFGGYKGRIAVVSLTIGLSFMMVGFLDDFIKIKHRENEGLKPLQKIFFQVVIAMLAGIFAFRNGITVFHLPFTKKSIELGGWTIPITALIFIAITNSVNLTDGLDGLAGNVSAVYLILMTFLIILQAKSLPYMYLKKEEYDYINLLNTALIGGIMGFLVFNQPDAKVFMGDTGSLSLGGFIGAISIFSSNSFFIPLIGIMFVLSSISVIIQVIHYKRTKRRVFLMAPLHHHFQLKGSTESQISYVYMLVTLVMGIICVLSYL